MRVGENNLSIEFSGGCCFVKLNEGDLVIISDRRMFIFVRIVLQQPV